MPLPGHRSRTLAMRPLWSLAIVGGWLCLFGMIGISTETPRSFLWLQLGWWLVVASFTRGGGHRSIARRLRHARGEPWLVRGLWNPAGEFRPGQLVPVTGGRPLDWRVSLVIAGSVALAALVVTPDWTWRAVIVSTFLVAMALLKPRLLVAAGVGYAQFPYRTGETATFDVRFARHAAAGDLRTFECRLRCVSEMPRRSFVVFWPEVGCLVDLPGRVVTREQAERRFVLEFDVPAEAPGTDLLSEPAIYWELVIASDWDGGRFEQALQVPVYGRMPAGNRLTSAGSSA